MADLSNLSDDELRALYNATPPAAPSLSTMSDADLKKLYNSLPPANPPVAGREQTVATGNPVTDIPRMVGTAGTELLASGAALPRTIAKGVDWASSWIPGVHTNVDQWLGSFHHPANPQYSLFPDYQTAHDVFFGNAGGGPNVEFAPQTAGQQAALDATRGVMGGVMGGPEAVLPSAAGAVTAGAASRAFPNHPLLAAMLGFIPGAWFGKQLQNIPQRIGAAVTNANPSEPYGAFTRQGLPTNLAGTSTGDPGLLAAEKMAARMPGSEAAISEARSNLLNAWQERLDQVANRLGNASTAQEAGISLQNEALKWLRDFKQKTGQLWQNFYTKVPQTTPVPVTNYQATLTKLLGTFPGAQETAGVLRPATIKSLSDALGVDLAGGDSLPWEAVKNIRTAIGEKLENPSTVADTSQAALRQLYGALTRDMEGGAASVGADALSAFHRANAATAAGHDLLENHLNPILKATNPEEATRQAMSQARLGGSRLGAVTFNLPGASGDLASYALRNAATANESPSALANALLGRRPVFSPEAKAVLFPDAGTQADISDLATVGRAMQPVERDLANSPTATHQARGIGRLLTAIELGREGHELGGWPGRVGGMALGYMSPNVMGRAAQATALNPWLSALYGRAIPLEGRSPSLLARSLLAPMLTQQPANAAGVPAIAANSGQ